MANPRDNAGRGRFMLSPRWCTIVPMTGKTKSGGAARAEIVTAAEALEHSLSRYETLTHDAQTATLSTRKGIERAARATQDAAEVGGDLGRIVASLAQCIQSMSERQAALSHALVERSHEIRARAASLQVLDARFTGLAEETAKINADVQEFAQVGTATDETKVAFLSGLRDRMAPLVAAARDLGREAGEASFPEVVKQADALSQTLASAKNKVELAAKRIGTNGGG